MKTLLVALAVFVSAASACDSIFAPSRSINSLFDSAVRSVSETLIDMNPSTWIPSFGGAKSQEVRQDIAQEGQTTTTTSGYTAQSQTDYAATTETQTQTEYSSYKK